jgi:Helix-turn-helix domain
MNAHHSVPPERVAALHIIRDTYSGNASATQRKRLITGIEQLQHVTTFEASRFLDVYSPPARKLELVREGHNIKTAMRDVYTEAGKRHRVGVYYLDKVQP